MDKRIISLLAVLTISTAVYAQDEADALRYSQLTTGGTARVQAIGGAMGSLGGDVSSLNVNPAGIGLFKTNELSITPGFKNINNEASYYNSTSSDAKSKLNLQSFGFIFAADKRKGSNSKWQNVTVGIDVNRLADFNNDIFYKGTISDKNNYSSYSDNYLIQLTNANETSYDNASKNYLFGTSEAVNAGLIGPVQGSPGEWSSLPSEVIADGYPLMQSNTISTKGGISEFSIGVAGNYADKFYIGGSINIPSINYDRTQTFRETNTQDQNSVLKYYDVTNYLSTNGTGVNAKIGVIFSPNPAVRIGGAFHTPTWYSMHDTYSTLVTVNSTDQGVVSSGTQDITGGYPGDYEYTLITPWRAIGSISYLFGEGAGSDNSIKGFITADYEFVNYASTKYRFNSSDATADDKSMADALNKSISNLYKGTSNIRVGGELKFNILAVRAGFAWYGSPYQNSNIDADKFLYSAGLGYRNKGVFLGLTYVYANQKGINQPYLVTQPNSLNVPSPQAATYTSNGSNVLLTLGVKF